MNKNLKIKCKNVSEKIKDKFFTIFINLNE